MKRKFIVVSTVLCMFITCFMLGEKTVKADSEMDKRAVWISYLDIDSLKNKSESTFRSNFDAMCKNAKSKDLNTVIVQVRPFSDALYNSKYYHWSSYISSNSTSPGYDPLKLMVDIAHANKLKIETWVNPYRISLSSYTYTTFKEKSPIKHWLSTDKVIKAEGTTYSYILNPAKTEVQDYIVNGMAEIAQNYDVDGIHMDDYFYITGTYGNTTSQQRKTYVNQLVLKAYQKIKSIKKDVTFGISPQGNVENCRSAGADVDTWLSNDGYVDYVMPQIYWSDQWGKDGNTTMFSNRIKQWNGLWKNKDIKLYAGLALYKVVEKPTDDIGWAKRSDNIQMQIESLLHNQWNGYSYFQYLNLSDSKAAKELENVVQSPIRLSMSSKTLYPNECVKLNVTSINQSVTWSSSNNDVAIVDSTGNVTAKKAGSTIIKVTTSQGKTASCTITVKPTMVILDKSTVTVYKGYTTTLKATTTPANGKVTWSTSNSKVATVSSSGVVSGKGNGTVYIYASYNGVKASTKVTVKTGSMKLSATSTTAYTGIFGYTLKATPTPSNAKVTWKSSNTSIATVSSTGFVTGKKAGTVTITASINGASKTCRITFKSPYRSIKSLKTNVNSLTFNKVRSYQVKVSYNPSTATLRKVKWSTSNSKVATVTSSGYVKAVKKGTCYITATAHNGVKRTIKVSVVK